MPQALPLLLRRPRALALLVFVIALGLSGLLIGQLEQQQRQTHRADLANLVQNHSFLIRDALDQALALNYSMAAMIQLNQGDSHYFEDFAREVLPFYPAVSHLSLSPQGVISKVYPLEGNEASLGFNQLTDNLQNREALRARDSGQLTLAGPVQLVQGGLGVVGRMPVFLQDQGGRHFWGFTNVTVRIPQLLETAKLPQLSSMGVAYRLWRQLPGGAQGEEILASADARLRDPVHIQVPVPNGTWTLSASPLAGWFSPWRLAAELAMGAVFSLLLAYLVYLMVQLRRRELGLRDAVAEQTRELLEARARLQATLDAIPDLLFEIGSDTIIYSFHSRRPERLLVPPERFMGQSFTRYLPEEVNQVILSAMDEASLKGFSEGRYYAMQLGDGLRYFELSVALKAGNGREKRFVMLSRDITERKEQEARINSLAFFDPLTQLPNRRLLQDRLEHALATSLRQHNLGALLYIDLDDFKTLNDTRSHHLGDLLLTAVGERLHKKLRSQDTVGRLGGDEFLVILENLGQARDGAAHQAQLIAEKILQCLNRPYNLEGEDYFNSPSIGICLFGMAPDEQPEELLKQADQAMYQAKSSGRNTLRFFDPAMQVATAQRFALQHELREALHLQQFQLYYQPQVDSRGHWVGVEALVRWLHPQRGLVPPTEFIPLAEDSGLILPLGQWILEQACAQLVAWAGDPACAGLTISVNVSARQFQQEDFVAQVRSVLARSGANPARLVLELTESLLAADHQALAGKMDALKHQGIQFSLDDFGTGYSSLSYLKRLPISELKIDRSFVKDVLSDPNDAAIARMIIRLAQSLELRVLAEGVETREQRDWLEREGCGHYQGYWFGRPAPAAQLLQQLRPQPQDVN